MVYGKNSVIWLDRGHYPPYVGFCPTKKAWHDHMRKWVIDGELYPTSDGHCWVWDDGGRRTILITVGDHIDKKQDVAGIIGLIAHECVHVWQHIRDDIGEKTPGFEQEAYAIQYLTMTCCQIYHETRRKLWR